MRASLPRHGSPLPEILGRMRGLAKDDVNWRDARTAVYVFNAGPEVEAAQREAYALFMAENALGPGAFPSLKRMEDDVIGFALGLLGAPEGACGAMTSGGTDSITMALKAARDRARRARGLEGPLNIVLPRTAHLAFDKAAALMEIEVRRTPTRDHLADPEAMAARIDAATVMIVGSAPCFPFGLIDPIAALAELARTRDVWLHVDACVGGFIAPFARMNGEDLPPFDFGVDGVSSMSADLHKYGYCAKGASCVLFRDDTLKSWMTFDFRDWPGGRMTTPTLAGTRPGGAVAAAWAVTNLLGEDGYRRLQGEVLEARSRIEAGVRSLGFSVTGAPRLGIVSFTHPEADIGALWTGLRRRGWFTSVTTEPKGLHLMLSPAHLAVTEAYLSDLAAALTAARSAPEAGAETPRYA